MQYVRVSDTHGSYVIRDLPLAPGPQTLTVTGRNVLGVTTTATTTVNVSTNTPSITITSPADNAYLPGDQPIAVTGTFSATGARVDINGNAATLDTTANTYSGSTAFSPGISSTASSVASFARRENECSLMSMPELQNTCRQ